jgi:predicted dehydrogenase
VQLTPSGGLSPGIQGGGANEESRNNSREYDRELWHTVYRYTFSVKRESGVRVKNSLIRQLFRALRYPMLTWGQRLRKFIDSNRIRLGIIGTGTVVRTHHLPAIQQLGNEVEVVAAAGRDLGRVRAFARDAKVPRVYANYRQLLQNQEIDAVLTAVPIKLNGKVLLDTIRAGKHVLAEKPIAETLIQARSIIRESQRSRRKVLIGENFRYRQDLAKAKALVERGAVGKPFAFQMSVKFDVDAPARRRWISRGWRQKARHRGGMVLDAGVHPVAAVTDILGEIREVNAIVMDTSRVIRGPDGLLMQIRTASGVSGQCFLCYTSKEEREISFDFSIYGTAGVLRVVPGEITLTRGVGDSPRVLKIRQIDGGYLAQWKNFCAAIRGEERVLSCPAEAYRDLLVIDAALRSSITGKTVRISASS